MDRITQVFRMDRATGTIEVVPAEVAFQALQGTYYIPLRALTQADAAGRPAWTDFAGYALSPLHFPAAAPGGVQEAPRDSRPAALAVKQFMPR
jgi:hypothetical protein